MPRLADENGAPKRNRVRALRFTKVKTDGERVMAGGVVPSSPPFQNLIAHLKAPAQKAAKEEEAEAKARRRSMRGVARPQRVLSATA